MKQTTFFRRLLAESWMITWRNKLWWFFGFLAVFVSGSIGYQLVTRNMYRLAQPELWINRWRWLSEFHPGVLLSGQWAILTSDPKGWFALLFGWSVVLLVLALLFVCSVFAVAVILSGLKQRQGAKLELVRAVMEARHHMRALIASVLGVYVISNLIMLAFSIPITVATLNLTGFPRTAVYAVCFLLVFLFSLLLSLLSMYTWMGIVFYDENLKHAFSRAWRFLRTRWIASLIMLITQIVIIVLTTLTLMVAISLVLIPIIIAGYLLVAYEQYDLTQYLPQLVFYAMVAVFTVLGAAYTVFQLASWSLLFTQSVGSEDADMIS